MNPFEMVVMIVAIVTLGSIIRGKTHGKFGKRYQANMADQIENKQLRSEIKEAERPHCRSGTAGNGQPQRSSAGPGN